MAYLYESEAEAKRLSREARSLIDGIRDGLSERKAASAAGVTGEELRRFKRDQAFRDAVQRAKTEGPHEPKVYDLRVYDDPSAPPPPGTSEFEIERQGWRRWSR